MREPVNNDNIYTVGTIIYAKAYPLQKLVIEQYLQRIYYCRVVDNPEHKQLAYFERELIAPDKTQS